jgi:hypothetical protein
MVWEFVIPAVIDMGKDYIEGKANEKVAKDNKKYQEKLDNLQFEREKSMIKDQQLFQNISNLKSSKLANLIAKSMKEGGSKQFEDSLNEFRKSNQSSLPAILSQTPAAVTKLQNLIRAQALPEQRAAASQARLALQQQGVRGPESALLQAMQNNRLQSELANRAESVALNQALQDRQTKIGALLADRGAMQNLMAQLALNSQEAARTPVVDEQQLDEIFIESEPNDNRNRINRKNISNKTLKDKEVQYIEKLDDLNSRLDQAVKNNDKEQIEYLESQIDIGEDLVDKIYAINEYEQNLYYDQKISGLTDKEIEEKVNDIYLDVIYRRRERPELNLTNKEEN